MLLKEKLLKILSRDNLLGAEKLDECFADAKRQATSVDKTLQSTGLLTEKQVLRVLSECLNTDYMERLSEGVIVPQDYTSKVSVHFSRTHNLIAVGEQDGTIKVATCAPLEQNPIDELAIMLDKNVVPVLAPRAEIAAMINKVYQQKVDVVDEMLAGLDMGDFADIAGALDGSKDLLDMANKAPIIKLVNMVFFQALKMRASDIHIQPYEDKLQVRYRIDGILYDMMTPPKKIQDAIISRIKVMGKMDIAERRLPQDGRDTIKLGDSEIDIRISSVPTSHGERIVMRLLDKSARLYEMEELGMDANELTKVSDFIGKSHGIVLVTGTTGSGKTTTLYAGLKRLNSTENNIITIEDPIEYHMPGISQIEVSEKKGLTFATGLRHIVRQDPDIIMVGEIRDLETAAIAIQSALTGHLVFSTLHTNDSSGSVTRLLDLGVEPYLVASSLIGVIAQRLVRLICKHCKEPYTPAPEELRKIGLTPEDLPEGKLYKGRGCEKCLNTGYLDRTGIYEILSIDDVMREQIMQRVGSNTIKQEAVRKGMKTLGMDGAIKVRTGQTTVEEVLRIITEMEVM
ncbi:MAG: type II secretion system ATPase GspE [Planctomycetes bacterium]|nr:type II secretion system ATPase GspE [Planctomycetota bacterium]